MARAKRHYIPEQIWHLTHRCHKREFLLKLVKDKQRWLHWLFEAKERYGLVILNFTVTSNHIHLLVFDEKGRDVIPSSLKLVAGRTGQEYKLKKKEKRSFLGRSVPCHGYRLRRTSIQMSDLYRFEYGS